MMFFIVERASMLIPSGPSHDPEKKHLFVVLTNPWLYQETQQVIIVNFSSIKDGKHFKFDETCIVLPKDDAHDFIKKDSFIDYAKARLLPSSKLQNGIDKGIFIAKGTIKADIFSAIGKGLLTSSHTPNDIKSAYRDYLGKLLA